MKALQELFGVTESYRLPDKILEALLSDDAEKIVKEVKANIDSDIRDMFQDEQGDREKLKQDFTPDCICQMVAGLIRPGDFLDMCSGTGVLGKAAAQKNHVEIRAQEYSERTIPFALLDACINGLEGNISRADCLRGKIYETYKLERRGGISIPKVSDMQEARLYDNVIMNPPYSMKFQDAQEYPVQGITIPKSKADYGFLLRGMEYLKEDGRLIAILPHGVLFRGQTEGKIREHLVRGGYINAVIGLPEKLFRNTGIPVCIIIIQKNSGNVLFINAEKEFKKGSKQNDMTGEQIRRILEAYDSRKEIERFSHVAGYDEIEKNNYNLNIPRYVDTFIPEPLPDVKELLWEMREIDAEIRKTEAGLYEMLGDLTGSREDMEVVKEHREILKPKTERRGKPLQAGQLELSAMHADALQAG